MGNIMKNKIVGIVYGIAAVIFTFLGITMIMVGSMYSGGIVNLASAFLLLCVSYMYIKKAPNKYFSKNIYGQIINMGFVLLAIGLGLQYVWLWGFGYLMIVGGLACLVKNNKLIG